MKKNVAVSTKVIWIFVAGACLCLAPFWAKHVQTVAGHGLFITPDSLVLLGITLLVSLLGYYILPDFVLTRFRQAVILRTQLEESKTRSFAPSGLRMTKTTLKFLAVVCGLLSIVGLVYILHLVNQHILHSFLSSADEHSCYFLAECLRKGKFFVDIPSHADFFKVVHVGMKGGKWFSVYPPGWPAIWAVGLDFNIVDWLNPILSSIAIFLFYLIGKRLFGQRSRLGQESQIPVEAAPIHWGLVVGLLVCVLSPFFMFTAASYFSHATCLLMLSIFLYAFLRWREARQAVLLSQKQLVILSQQQKNVILSQQQPVILSREDGEESKERSFVTSFLRMTRTERSEIFWSILCSFAFGYGCITRPLTTFAVAAPFLLYHYLPLFVTRREGGYKFLRGAVPFVFKRPELRKSDWIFLVIPFFCFLILTVQNYLVTGKPFKAPLKYYQSWERLGFKPGHYTPVDGFFFVIARIFYLMDWFAPGFVAAYLVLLTRLKSVILRAKPEESQSSTSAVGSSVDGVKLLFILAPVFLAFAYFLYYSWGGNQWGPRYWWEALPFLSIAVADSLGIHWRQGSLRTRKFIAVFVLASIATSGILFVKHAKFTEEASRQRRALYDLAESSIREPAIVFIHGFLGNRLVIAEEDATRNPPFLDTRILYVHDLGDRNKELIDAYPGRAYYRGTYNTRFKRPELQEFIP